MNIGRLGRSPRAASPTVSPAKSASSSSDASSSRAGNLGGNDKIGHARREMPTIPEPTPPAADAASPGDRFKAARLKISEGFRPSDKRLQKQVEKYDDRIPAQLEKRDEHLRKTIASGGSAALGDENVTRTVLSHDKQIKGYLAPGVELRPAADGFGKTARYSESGENATFADGLKLGALDGFTNKSAERAGLSVEDYKKPGKRVMAKAAGTALPTVGDASKFGLDQKKLDHNAKGADRAAERRDDLREKRAQEKAGTTVVQGSTRYYDPVADVDTRVTTRADAVDAGNGALDALNNKRALDIAPADASLKSARSNGGIESQVHARDRRAADLEAKFAPQHNETLQAWGDRNAAQRQIAYEGVEGAFSGLISHRPGTHLGANIGNGIGEAVQPASVNKVLQTQGRLDKNAGEFAKTRGDLHEIRKQEAFEGLTDARAHKGDVFYDAAESPAEIAARDAASHARADQALPKHTVLAPNRLPKEYLGLVPDGATDGYAGLYGAKDGVTRLLSNQDSIDRNKI